MDALVSIIVPVYNLEDYIENCINSIISQTYKNLEIICVNDGSTDMSSDKIMAIKDDRIRLINQKNAGVSAARNLGLKEATGDYVMFVDGDDYIHFQTVEILLKSAEKTGCDMTCSYHCITNSLNETMEKITDYSDKIINIQDLFVEKDNTIIGKSSCSKLIKRELAVLEKFPEGVSNGEDGYYIIMILSHDISIDMVDLNLYYYYTRENSTVTSNFNFSKFSITYCFEDICERLVETDCTFLKSYSLQYLYQTIFYNRTMAIGIEEEKKILAECKRIGNRWMKTFFKEKGINIKIKIMFFCFFHSRLLYEFARAVKDPTMKDFYRSRKRKD